MTCTAPRPVLCGDIRKRWVFPILPLRIPVYDGGYHPNFRPARMKYVWLEWVKVVEEFMYGRSPKGAFRSWQIREEDND